MTPTPVILTMLLLVAFSLGAWLEPWHREWRGRLNRSDHLLTVALGDSRRLFANHFFSKADEYFHRGYYPSVFDRPASAERTHAAANVARGAGEVQGCTGPIPRLDRSVQPPLLPFETRSSGRSAP
jgi:hypothetical protein